MEPTGNPSLVSAFLGIRIGRGDPVPAVPPEVTRPERTSVSRRGFLSTAALLSLLGATAAAIRLGLRFLSPAFSPGSASVFRVGRPADYAVGARRLLQRERVLIAREASGFRALSAVCTHLSCTVTLMEWGFNCPCHGSKFDWDGLNFAGPAPRPLDCFELSLSADGELVVDTRRVVPRQQFFSPQPMA